MEATLTNGHASISQGITPVAIVAKISSLLFNRIQHDNEKVLRRNQNDIRENRSAVRQILTVHHLFEGIKAINLEAVLLFVDCSKALNSIHYGKIEKILLVCGIPEERTATIMMLYNNIKSLDEDTSFFVIRAEVLQGVAVPYFLFVITLDNVLRTPLHTHEI